MRIENNKIDKEKAKVIYLNNVQTAPSRFSPAIFGAGFYLTLPSINTTLISPFTFSPSPKSPLFTPPLFPMFHYFTVSAPNLLKLHR